MWRRGRESNRKQGTNEKEPVQTMWRDGGGRKDGEETTRPAHLYRFKSDYPDWHENRKECHII